MNQPIKAQYCVIGSNSFSGQDFVDFLLEQTDADVIAISRSSERPDFLLQYKSKADRNRVKFFQLDMNTQMGELQALLDLHKPTHIINFAAQSEVGPSWDHPEHWYETNTVALARLIKHLAKQDYLDRYLHISSPEVYGSCSGVVRETERMNPSTPYAASKAAADMLLEVYRKQFDFPLLSVRATNVYGPRQQLFKIIPRSIIYLKQERIIELHGGGTAVKSYIHIRDVSRATFSVLEEGTIGELYHISPDKGFAVRDVVQTICAHMGRSFEDSTAIVDERPGQDAAYVIDSSKLRKQFGWAPQIGLDEGISDCVAWVNKNWESIISQPLHYVHKA